MSNCLFELSNTAKKLEWQKAEKQQILMFQRPQPAAQGCNWQLFRLSIKMEIIFLNKWVICLVCEMSGNGEKGSAQFPKAQADAVFSNQQKKSIKYLQWQTETRTFCASLMTRQKFG